MPIAFSIVFTAVCGQGLFLAGLLLLHKRNRAAHRTLAVLVLLLVLHLFSYAGESFFNWSFQRMGHYVTLYILMEPLGFLFGPLFYYYISFFSKNRLKIRFRDFFHIFPFLIHLSYNLFFCMIEKEGQFTIVNNFYAGRFRIIDMILLFAMFLHLAAYLFFSLKHLAGYAKQIREVTSNIHQMSLDWLRVIVIIFLFICISGAATYIYFILFQIENSVIDYIFTLGIICFIYVTSVKTYLQPEVLTPVLSDDQSAKYGRNRLPENVLKDEFNIITSIVVSKKLYLESELTINDLAQKTGMTVNRLSQIINASTGKSFFNFINGFRVDHAKELFSDPAFNDFTVLRIAYESGFNSKPTFNSIFKQMTGITPTQFRKQNACIL